MSILITTILGTFLNILVHFVANPIGLVIAIVLFFILGPVTFWILCGLCFIDTFSQVLEASKNLKEE